MASDLRLTTRVVETRLITRIRLEAQLSPEMIGELAKCSKSNAPMQVTIIAPQLTFGGVVGDVVDNVVEGVQKRLDEIQTTDPAEVIIPKEDPRLI